METKFKPRKKLNNNIDPQTKGFDDACTWAGCLRTSYISICFETGILAHSKMCYRQSFPKIEPYLPAVIEPYFKILPELKEN